ncbi:MAG: type III-A CRISPR-associated RAMP protein Csm5, partial [Bryobacteraceae bacterium]
TGGRRMNYKVTALTPLLVGDGRALSPIDYMVWKDQVNVLDQRRIFRLLARGPRLDGYLSQLRKAAKLDFASWGGFAQNFSERRILFEHPGSTAIWNAAASELLFIPTFAADYRGPYLPGSALKGALRTGFVFAHAAAETIERAAGSIEGDRAPRRLGEAAETSARASQTRRIGVADSQPAPASAFQVFLTRVASLDTRQASKPQLAWKIAGRGSVPPARIDDATPTFAEMAVPGTSFNGEWDDRGQSGPEPNAFIEAANRFAAAQLDLHARYAEIANLAPLAEAMQRLNQELAGIQNRSNTCLLCLGWGSGFVSKSAFPDTGQESYRKILRAVPSIGRSLREGVLFPKTRRVIFLGGRPATLPGWVRLELGS